MAPVPPRPLPAQPDDLIVVGHIVGPHGNDGTIRVQSDSDNPKRFQRGARLIANGQDLRVGHARSTSGGLLLRIEGVTGRDAAVGLKGATLYVKAADAPEAPPDTYYHYQLLGMTAVDPDGAELGTVAEIVSTGSNDVYVVVSDAAELLVPARTLAYPKCRWPYASPPARPHVVGAATHVDVGAGRMIIAIPEGLEWRTLNPAKPKPKRPRRRKARSA